MSRQLVRGVLKKRSALGVDGDRNLELLVDF